MELLSTKCQNAERSLAEMKISLDEMKARWEQSLAQLIETTGEKEKLANMMMEMEEEKERMLAEKEEEPNRMRR